MGFIEELGRMFIPKKARPHLKEYLWKAGLTRDPYETFGMIFLLGMFWALAVHLLFVYKIFIPYTYSMPAAEKAVIMGLISLTSVIVITSATMGMIMIVTYFFLDLKIYNRTKSLEDILPDFLETVASNLRGGLSFEKSLWTAINPRFGILSAEIAIVAKKVMTGHDIEAALTEFSHKYDSPMLKRSIELIVGEIKGGGNVADIIDDIVEDLKNTKELKEEIRTSVLSYIIFITAVVVVISPLLFALAYNLLEILGKIMGVLASSMSGTQDSLPFQFRNVKLNAGSFSTFSYVALGIIAVFASMIVSIVEKGSIKGGVKFIPIYLISSQVFYWIFFNVLTLIFSQMISF